MNKIHFMVFGLCISFFIIAGYQNCGSSNKKTKNNNPNYSEDSTTTQQLVKPDRDSPEYIELTFYGGANLVGSTMEELYADYALDQENESVSCLVGTKCSDIPQNLDKALAQAQERMDSGDLERGLCKTAAIRDEAGLRGDDEARDAANKILVG